MIVNETDKTVSRNAVPVQSAINIVTESDGLGERRRAVLSTNNQKQQIPCSRCIQSLCVFSADARMYFKRDGRAIKRRKGYCLLVFLLRWWMREHDGVSAKECNDGRKKGDARKKRTGRKGEAPGKMSSAARRGKRDK
jgi:hypothetical protein